MTQAIAYIAPTSILYVPYVQIALAVLLICAILVQKTGSSLGGAFGADNFSSGFHTRRGAEKVLFNTTIVLAVLLVVSACVTLVIR
jgi:preprotein translocase subunit SecG